MKPQLIVFANRVGRALFSRLRGGGLATFVCQSSGLSLIFAAQVLLARVLGASGYGVFVYVTAWIGVLGIVARCGLDTAVLRDAGIHAARSDWSSFRSLIVVASRWVLVTGSVVGASCAAAVAVFVHGDWLLLPTFLVGTLLLPVSAVAAVRQTALLALKRPWAALAPEYILRPLLLGGAVLLLVVLRVPLSAPGAMAANLVAVAVTVTVGVFLLDRAVPKAPVRALSLEQARTLKSSAGTLLWFNGSGQLLYQIDTILIGSLVGPAAAGRYYAAKQIALIAGLGLVALQLAAGPRIAALSASGERQLLQRELSTVAWQGLAFAVACAALLSLVGDWALTLFGSDFETAFPVMMVLVFGQMIGAAGGAAGQLAAMSGLQSEAATVYVSATLLNVILGALTIPAYGVTGAAVVVVVVTLIWIAVLNLLLWQRTGVVPAIVSYWPR